MDPCLADDTVEIRRDTLIEQGEIRERLRKVLASIRGLKMNGINTDAVTNFYAHYIKQTRIRNPT